MVWDLLVQLPSWLAPVQTSQDNTHGLLALHALELARAWRAELHVGRNVSLGLADPGQLRLGWRWVDRSLLQLGQLGPVEYWDIGRSEFRPVRITSDPMEFLGVEDRPEPLGYVVEDRLYLRNLMLAEQSFSTGTVPTLASYPLTNRWTGSGPASILRDAPVYWSEDGFETWGRLAPDSGQIEHESGRVWLENSVTGATVTIRYVSGDLLLAGQWSASISLQGSALSVPRMDFWNGFDQIGLWLGCSRISNEDNVTYRARLRTVFRAPAHPSPIGCRLGLGRALGRLQSTGWTVSSLSTTLELTTGGQSWLVDAAGDMVGPSMARTEDLQPDPTGRYWYFSRRPIGPDLIELRVDHQLVSVSLTSVPGCVPADVPAVELQPREAVQAQYLVQLWQDTGTQLHADQLPPGRYEVYWVSDVTVHRLMDPVYQQRELLDARGLPTETFVKLVQAVQRAVPICWGQARWDRGIYFFGVDEPKPQLCYLPNVWDVNRTYPNGS